MILYKYVSTFDSVENIVQGSLKFTPISELNDPSELTPSLTQSEMEKSLADLRHNGFSEHEYEWLLCQGRLLSLLAPEEQVIQAPHSIEAANNMLTFAVYENLEYMKRKLEATMTLIKERVGVLSLSSRYDSLPMWAHYANNANGFVVQFEELEKEFCGDATGSLNAVKSVEYVDKFLGMNFFPSTQDRIFFSKIEDWRYEEEWRIVKSLESCKKVGNLYLHKMNSRHVPRVIFGWKIKQEQQLDHAQRLLTLSPHLKFSYMEFIGGKIVMTDLKVTEKD